MQRARFTASWQDTSSQALAFAALVPGTYIAKINEGHLLGDVSTEIALDLLAQLFILAHESLELSQDGSLRVLEMLYMLYGFANNYKRELIFHQLLNLLRCKRATLLIFLFKQLGSSLRKSSNPSLIWALRFCSDWMWIWRRSSEFDNVDLSGVHEESSFSELEANAYIPLLLYGCLFPCSGVALHGIRLNLLWISALFRGAQAMWLLLLLLLLLNCSVLQTHYRLGCTRVTLAGNHSGVGLLLLLSAVIQRIFQEVKAGRFGAGHFSRRRIILLVRRRYGSGRAWRRTWRDWGAWYQCMITAGTSTYWPDEDGAWRRRGTKWHWTEGCILFQAAGAALIYHQSVSILRAFFRNRWSLLLMLFRFQGLEI